MVSDGEFILDETEEAVRKWGCVFCVYFDWPCVNLTLRLSLCL